MIGGKDGGKEEKKGGRKIITILLNNAGIILKSITMEFSLHYM